MKVRSSTRHLAIRLVFDDLNTLNRRRISDAQLRRAWHRTGLRQSDLHVEVRELMLDHCLDRRSIGDECFLQLTDAGVARLSASPGPPLQVAADWLTLARARARRGFAGVPTQFSRRISDRIH